MNSPMKASGLGPMIRNRLRRKEIYSQSAYWDAKATDYADDSVSWWPNNHLNACHNREQIDQLDAYLPEMTGRTILELGCGTGRISRHLAGRGAIVHGMDFSAKSIEMARRLTSGSNPTYERRSVFEIDDDQRFDAIVSVGVVMIACKSRAELLDVLHRVHRALKPGGTLVVMEPIHNSFLHRVLKMSRREFLGTTAEAGFTVREVRPMHFWPARLALAYVPWPRWFTRAGYTTGQGLMKLLGCAGGDYQAILAMPSPGR
jgi:2-polyprenyl-3-methyl-5-hydroxy-6-metoxy-1,4-benzoquinol methylase